MDLLDFQPKDKDTQCNAEHGNTESYPGEQKLSDAQKRVECSMRVKSVMPYSSSHRVMYSIYNFREQ